MNSTTSAPSSHRTARAFEQYVSGKRALIEGAAFFLESGEHLDDVLRVAGRGDVVFASTGTSDHGDPRVVGYDGGFREPGDEMTLDGRHSFELQDYRAVPFISIVGPTVVRQGSAEGVASFLRDADTARDSGVFVDQLLSGAVLLDSLSSFIRSDPAGEALVRVHVTAEGAYRDGPDGLLLGNVGDGRAVIEASAARGSGRGRAFARIVDRRALRADLDDRPWLERYVAALDLLRRWDGAPTRPAISGFGGHLVKGLDGGAASPRVVSAAAPFLVTGDGEEYVLVDRASRRRVRLGVDAARAAECLIATADESVASDLLAADLGRSAGSVDGVVREVRERCADAGVELVPSRREDL